MHLLPTMKIVLYRDTAQLCHFREKNEGEALLVSLCILNEIEEGEVSLREVLVRYYCPHAFL